MGPLQPRPDLPGPLRLGPAQEDLRLALEAFRSAHRPEERPTRLEMGYVRQALGDQRGARDHYDRVIAADAGGKYARAARVNRAKLDVDVGAADRARAEYDALIAEDPADASAASALLGRALLALRVGEPGAAEADLTALLGRPEGLDPDDPPRAEVLAHRALALLILGRPDDAERDAAEAFRRAPSPARERLWARALVATGRVDPLRLDRPDEVARGPRRGRGWPTRSAPRPNGSATRRRAPARRPCAPRRPAP